MTENDKFEKNTFLDDDSLEKLKIDDMGRKNEK